MRLFKPSKAQYIFENLQINLSRDMINQTKKIVNIVFFNEADYPSRLLALYDFPFVLFYQGDLNLLKNNYPLAIIGSRYPSEYSTKVLHYLFPNIQQYQPVIISGLAYGVDSLAHRLAIQYHLGTIGVLAFGHHYCYPKANEQLFDYMKAHECVISEYPPQQKIIKYQFVARNRLIAALADKILITEAAQKSGTQITVDFALDLGKDIYCIPGDITSSLSQTPNNYLKEGAIIVTQAQDIFEL